MSAQLGWARVRDDSVRHEPFDERSARKVRGQPRTPQLSGNPEKPENPGNPENSSAQRGKTAPDRSSSWITELTEYDLQVQGITAGVNLCKYSRTKQE